jgi:2'-5' RNA ligase
VRRAFLAIVPPSEVLDAIETLVERRSSTRFAWTRREQWHVTVQFYGRVADDDALRAALAPAIARVTPPRVQVRGGGAFPSPRRAQIYWLGLDGGDGLWDVRDAVVSATESFIARRDRVAFRPHLTLARLKRTTDLTADVTALENAPIGTPWELEELTLLESDTRSSGAVYTEQARFPLVGP